MCVSVHICAGTCVEDAGFHDAEATGNCEPPDWELNLGPLEM